MKVGEAGKLMNILGVLFLVVIVSAILRGYMKEGVWSEQLGLNLLVVGDDSIGVLILRPKERTASWISLPSDMKIRVTNSPASYPITSLWRFGVSEKKPYEIVEKSIGESIGVVIPRVVKMSGKASVEDLLGKLLSITLRTDLSLLDRLALRGFLSETVAGKRLLELTVPSQAFDSVEEPDGKVFKVFSLAVNAWSKDKFLIDSILSENVDLSINNMSGVNGFGLLMARQAETAGIRVVEIKNDPGDMVVGKGCFFVIDEGLKWTEKWLQDHFKCKKIESEKGRGEEVKMWLQ